MPKKMIKYSTLYSCIVISNIFNSSMYKVYMLLDPSSKPVLIDLLSNFG
jgi:hypothetical protein